MGLIAEFQQADEARRREVKQLQDEVSTMLRDLRGQAQERQAEVTAIAQEATAIVEAADTFVKDLAKGSAERASEVGKIHSEVANMFKDLAHGHTERANEIAAIHEMVWGKAPARKIVATSQKTLVAEQTAADELRARVFTYLTNHPDGTRLTELEEAFGVARLQTARVIRELIDSNKVAKRELLYFAI